MQIKLSIQLSI